MLKATVKRLIRRSGFETKRRLPPDLDQESIDIFDRVRPYTMTSPERAFALIQAVKYVVRANVPGSIVECGVWRGGSMMAVAYALQALGHADKDIYLFDTYEGMARPTAEDICHAGTHALMEFENRKTGKDSSEWCRASIEDVRSNLLSTGYDADRLKFVKGKVEETIPDSAPEQISILRLDTDWYESTRHELIHLYPRLAKGGVLIIDDYGYWQGCRKAVDEYFNETRAPILLNRVDHTGRIAVKS